MYEWFALLLDIKQIVWMVFLPPTPTMKLIKFIYFGMGHTKKKSTCA